MSQESIIKRLIERLDQHKVIRLQMEYLDGKTESFLFHPYLVSNNPENSWIYLYGKVPGIRERTSIPIPFIVSFEETLETFSIEDRDVFFLISDAAPAIVLKSVSEIQIIDISEHDIAEEEENVIICPYCDLENNCKHLVFEYDLTFHEFKSGKRQELNELRKMIADYYLSLFVQDKEVKFKEQSEQQRKITKYLNELWLGAKGSYEPNDSNAYIDEDAFIKLIEFVFFIFEIDGTAHRRKYPEGNYAPGFDSAMLSYYADDPISVMKEAGLIIKECWE